MTIKCTPARVIASWAIIFLTASINSGCAASRPPAAVSAEARSAKGHLVVVGGGPIPVAVTRRFVELAGQGRRPLIGVLPMASAVASTGPEKVAELRALGADAFVLDTRLTGAEADSVVRRIESATGFWFSGGDQNRIINSLGGSKAARAITAAYNRGAVIGGTSAGAAAMSSVMITGDERRIGGARPPSDSSQAYITIDRDNVVTASGLGLIAGAIVDQHFVRRKRQNRLVSLVLENPSLIGVGIDESTALLVKPDGTWEVLGESVAVIFDARRSDVTASGEPLGAGAIQMHVLPSGSLFDPATGRVMKLGSRPRR